MGKNKNKDRQHFKKAFVSDTGELTGETLLSTLPSPAPESAVPEGSGTLVSIGAFFDTPPSGGGTDLILPDLNILYHGNDGLEWIVLEKAAADLRTVFVPRGMEPAIRLEIEADLDQV